MNLAPFSHAKESYAHGTLSDIEDGRQLLWGLRDTGILQSPEHVKTCLRETELCCIAYGRPKAILKLQGDIQRVNFTAGNFQRSGVFPRQPLEDPERICCSAEGVGTTNQVAEIVGLQLVGMVHYEDRNPAFL